MNRRWLVLLLAAGCGGCASEAPSPADCRVEGGRFAVCGTSASGSSSDSSSAVDAEDEPTPDAATDLAEESPADTATSDTTPDIPSDSPADSAGVDPHLDPPSEPIPDPDSDPDTPTPDAADVSPGPCPVDMVHVESFCMDRYEAPNIPGEVPFVMFHLYEAEAWCEARGKRLCWDDEWSLACGGPDALTYPYGNERIPGRCNDEETWRVYNQSLLNGWPSAASTAAMETLVDQLSAARAVGTAAAAAADHIEALYQGEAAGQNPDCAGTYGVYDLVGNVEEWTLRRDGGSGPDFSGRLLGRYWAESRTCHGGVISHGNAFRFYEIGFRCCQDPE